MADAAVETGEQGGGLIGDDGGFEVGAGEVADGFEGTPIGFDDDFDFVFAAGEAKRSSPITGDAAELGEKDFGKVVEESGRIHFSGGRRRVTMSSTNS